jgi:hypothetical protein
VISPIVETSFFLALVREDARRLFGLPGDDRLWSFVAELRESETVAGEARKLIGQADWKKMHEQLAAEGFPLDHCFLGGREMAQDESRGKVVLKRPDVVAHIAAALEKRGPDQPPPPELRDFYRRAADEKCAVLFCWEWKPRLE